MYAVEFKTIVKDGMIKIPSSYIPKIAGTVKVIILKEEQTASDDVYVQMKAISKRCAALSDQDARSADEILGYNEIGVPE